MARPLTVALGVWLFVSAFAWPHSHALSTGTWVAGALAVASGLVAMFVDTRARFVTAAVAVGLLLAAFTLPAVHSGTIWNNAIVALVMLACSLVPGGGVRRAAIS